MDEDNLREDHAALGTLRAVLETHATPGTLAPQQPAVDAEAAELARAIEALADERDRLSQELRFAHEQAPAEWLAVSS